MSRLFNYLDWTAARALYDEKPLNTRAEPTTRGATTHESASGHAIRSEPSALSNAVAGGGGSMVAVWMWRGRREMGRLVTREDVGALHTLEEKCMMSVMNEY